MIRSESAGDVTVLTLDDPGRRNALTPAMSLALAEGVLAALDGGARALVLASTPPVFCAGGSLDELAKGPAMDLDVAYAGLVALREAPVPVVAAVDGGCVGAGLNLALVADVVLATPRAFFDARWLDVGIHPGGAHLWHLQRRVGPQAAAAMVLCGERLSGERAVECGLAYGCVTSGTLPAEALRLAGRAAGRDPELVRRAKATLRAVGEGGVGHGEAFALERAAQEWSVSRPGFVEGVEALRARLGRT